MKVRVFDIGQQGRPWTSNPDNSGWWLKVEELLPDGNAGDQFNLDVSAPTAHEYGIGEILDIEWDKDGRSFEAKFGTRETWYKGKDLGHPTINNNQRGGRPGGNRPQGGAARPGAPTQQATAQSRPQGAGGASGSTGSAPARQVPTIGQRLTELVALIPRGVKVATACAPEGATPDGILQAAVSIAMHAAIGKDRGDLRRDPTPEELATAKAAKDAALKAEADRLAREAEAAQRRAEEEAAKAPGYAAANPIPADDDDQGIPF